MQSKYVNHYLQDRYKQNSSFKALMNQNQQRYNQLIQQSYYADLSKVNTKSLQIIIQNSDVKDNKGNKIYSQKQNALYIYSYFQPEISSEMHKFMLYFIKQFSQPKQSYYLVYVNSFLPGKQKGWSNFKSYILQRLPLKYLIYLKKVILIRPTLLDKATSIVQFGVQNRFLKEVCQKFDSLKSYFDCIGFKFNQMRKILPTQIVKQECDQQIIKPVFSSLICKLNQNRLSFEINQQELKNIKPQNGKQIKKRKKIEQYSTGQTGIPLVLQLLIFYFTEVPQRCLTQGLFRKCTSIQDQNRLVEQLQKENFEILAKISNDIAVASAIKRFLSRLDPPLIPYAIYQKFIENHSIEKLKKEINYLSIINFMTLTSLIKFFREHIIPNSNKNLMSLQNISICIAPCLMKSKQITDRQFKLANLNVQITKTMINNFEEIFGDNQQQKRKSKRTFEIYRKNSKQVENEINFLIEKTYLEENKHNQVGQEVSKHFLGSGQSKSKFERLPSFGCPQDFLKPVWTIEEKDKQNESQMSSQICCDQQQKIIEIRLIGKGNKSQIRRQETDERSYAIQKDRKYSACQADKVGLENREANIVIKGQTKTQASKSMSKDQQYLQNRNESFQSKCEFENQRIQNGLMYQHRERKVIFHYNNSTSQKQSIKNQKKDCRNQIQINENESIQQEQILEIPKENDDQKFNRLRLNRSKFGCK